MAEATKKTEPPRQLARAAEATDPAVHHLLAEIQTARMNENADRLAALTKQLNDLGYE
ncbi:MAG TPA: hypothetical protein VFC00_30690 [Micromonosporaceae bacterium]|nr:hypothetical protein [Micromonosporaceae bacterium]